VLLLLLLLLPALFLFRYFFVSVFLVISFPLPSGLSIPLHVRKNRNLLIRSGDSTGELICPFALPRAAALVNANR